MRNKGPGPARGRVTAETNSTTAWCGTLRLSSCKPRSSHSAAMRCLRRSPGSNTYTRTFVSTSAATLVQVLPPPASPNLVGLKWALKWCFDSFEVLLSASLAFQHFAEQDQSLLHASKVLVRGPGVARNHPNHIA